MGGCSAPFCNNSTKKGYIMKVFPRNPERRAVWLQNIGRENWIPTDNSYLCEVHFSPEMWEKRADNKPKLKPNATPTIFGFFIKKKVSENEKDTQVSIENNQINNMKSSQPIDILDEECQISI